MNKELDKQYSEKLMSINTGKEVFDRMIGRRRRENDRYILILTDKSEWIEEINKLYPELKKESNGNIYVLSRHVVAGVCEKEMIICEDEELRELADYFSLFTEEFGCCEQVVYVVDDDTYGSNIEELRKKEKITDEEYIGCCLFGL